MAGSLENMIAGIKAATFPNIANETNVAVKSTQEKYATELGEAIWYNVANYIESVGSLRQLSDVDLAFSIRNNSTLRYDSSLQLWQDSLLVEGLADYYVPYGKDGWLYSSADVLYKNDTTEKVFRAGTRAYIAYDTLQDVGLGVSYGRAAVGVYKNATADSDIGVFTQSDVYGVHYIEDKNLFPVAHKLILGDRPNVGYSSTANGYVGIYRNSTNTDSRDLISLVNNGVGSTNPFIAAYYNSSVANKLLFTPTEFRLWTSLCVNNGSVDRFKVEPDGDVFLEGNIFLQTTTTGADTNRSARIRVIDSGDVPDSIYGGMIQLGPNFTGEGGRTNKLFQSTSGNIGAAQGIIVTLPVGAGPSLAYGYGQQGQVTYTGLLRTAGANIKSYGGIIFIRDAGISSHNNHTNVGHVVDYYADSYAVAPSVYDGIHGLIHRVKLPATGFGSASKELRYGSVLGETPLGNFDYSIQTDKMWDANMLTAVGGDYDVGDAPLIGRFINIRIRGKRTGTEGDPLDPASYFVYCDGQSERFSWWQRYNGISGIESSGTSGKGFTLGRAATNRISLWGATPLPQFAATPSVDSTTLNSADMTTEIGATLPDTTDLLQKIVTVVNSMRTGVTTHLDEERQFGFYGI